MKLLGWEMTVRRKAAVSPTNLPTATSADSWNYDTVRAGWFSLLRESFAGAWQRGVSNRVEDILSHSTAWACITLIAGDIAKMRPKLMLEASGITEEIENPAYTPVLTKPNHYQNRIQFYMSWIVSKLTRGNAFVLKERDGRGVVTALYVLDPSRVQVLVSPDGSVFYRVSSDKLAGLEGDVVVPASEVIHDVYVAPYHPLCGISPIYACALAAGHGQDIVRNMQRFFENGSQPSGIITVPTPISPENAKRLEEQWSENFTGQDNIGKVAVIGNGGSFTPLNVTAVDSQVIEQLKWGDEKVCSVFHVPPYMVGVGQAPTYNNIEALNQQYYAQCLQVLIESLELCLVEGLGLKGRLGIEFDLDGLLRMDSATKMKMATEAVTGGIWSPNEGRARFNLRPVAGGETPYLQQQNYSLAALARRDALADPFARPAATAPAPAAALPPSPDDEPDLEDDTAEQAMGELLRKGFGVVAA